MVETRVMTDITISASRLLRLRGNWEDIGRTGGK